MATNGIKLDFGSGSAVRALAEVAAGQQADLRAAMATSLVPAMQQLAAAYKPVVSATVASDMMRNAIAALEPVRVLSNWSPKLTIPRLPTPVVPAVHLPTGMFDVLRGFDWDAFERRIRTPANWPTNYELYLPGLVSIVHDEGIPLAWVPRWQLVESMLDAPDAATRSMLLVDHRTDILNDCEGVLNNITDASLLPFMPTVHEMLNACRYGLWKVAAMAAVAMTHSIVESLSWVSDRQRVAKHHALTEDVSLAQLTERSTRGPLVLFYDDWNPKSRRPRPTHLTRHVMSHRFGPEQVADRNCVVAVMLLASLMTTVDQLELRAQPTSDSSRTA